MPATEPVSLISISKVPVLACVYVPLIVRMPVIPGPPGCIVPLLLITSPVIVPVPLSTPPLNVAVVVEKPLLLSMVAPDDWV